MKARIRSASKLSPFRLEVSQTKRGVFFDRVDTTGGGSKTLMIHTTPRQARLLAQWILDNIHPED